MSDMNGLLFDFAPGKPSEMEQAVEVTIKKLNEDHLLKPEHAALVQLARELARAIAAGARLGKTSTPQAAQQLLAVLDAFPKPIDVPADDPVAAAMRSEADQ